MRRMYLIFLYMKSISFYIFNKEYIYTTFENTGQVSPLNHHHS